MKKLSKRMIISVLTLVLTIAALGTTTFAWFSLSTTSRVSAISGNVTGGEGLEIRLLHHDGTTEHKTPWLANIDQTQVADFISSIFSTTNVANKFDAVSTTDNLAFTKMAQNDTTSHLEIHHPAVANKDYLLFEIQFKSQTGGNVNLDSLTFSGDAYTFTPDGNAYIQTSGTTSVSSSDVVTKAAYGARISFARSTSDFDVYQMGNDTSTGAGVNTVMSGTTPVRHGQFSYLTDGRGLILSDGTSRFVHGTAGAGERSINDVTILAAAGHTTLNTSVALAEAGETGSVSGEAGFSSSLTVRIWIEGWDADSYDSIYTLNLIVDLVFKKDI